VDAEVARRHPDALCEACPLFARGVYVPAAVPRGDDKTAELLIVGEAPGGFEAVAGRPFVGPSGQLLEQSLGQITDKDRWFVTNAVACYAHDKKVTPVTIRCCRPRLVRELADWSVGAAAIVSLGAAALQSVKGDLGARITRERGRVFDSEWGVAVVPTYHPAHILRQGAMWSDYKRDLELVPDILDGVMPERMPMPEVTVIDEPARARRFIAWLWPRDGLVSYDIETGVNLKRIRHDTDKIACISFAWDDGGQVVVLGEAALRHPNVWADLQWLFGGAPRIRWGAQNGKYDSLNLLMKGIDARVDVDSMLLHYALDERKGTHDLKSMSTEFLGSERYDDPVHKAYMTLHRERMKAWQAEARKAKKAGVAFATPKPVTTYYDLDRPLLYQYGGIDAGQTQRLILRFERECAQAGVSDLVTHLHRMNRYFTRMERVGVLIDRDYKVRLGGTLAGEIERLEAEIREYTWDGFNPNATAQVAKALFHPEYAGLLPPKGTKRNNDGNWSTAKEVLKALTGQHPLVDLELSWRSLTKLKASYVDNLEQFIYESDLRTRTSVKIHGTVTGRVSCGDPALMTLPKPDPTKPSIRDLVIAKPGYKLLEADQSQGELRIAAVLSGEPAWVAAFRNGVDLHAGTMRKVGLGTLESATVEMGGDMDAGEKLYELRRKWAKNTAFGTLYGMGEFLLAHMFGWPVYKAKQFLDDYWASYPTLRAWVDEVRALAWSTGELRTPFGRVRRYGLITADNMKSVGNEASNYYPQSILSDCTIEAAMDLFDELDADGIEGVEPILFQHDANVLEVREDLVPYVAARMVHHMERVPMLRLAGVARADVPFVADVKVGDAWGSMKHYAPPAVAGRRVA
jgi:uracil-DNA glycosylase family 4